MNDQASPPKQDPPENETWHVPNYRVFEPIGEGGYGIVLRGVEASPFALAAAVKIISPLNGEDPAKRFLREAEALRKLSHKGIVRYLTCGYTTDTPPSPFLAMQFVEGTTLRAWAPLQPFVARIGAVIAVLDALEHAHKEGVHHRDVKPSNVLVQKSDGEPVLVDFGLAYVFEGLSSEDLTTRYTGSMGYIPEEVQANVRLRTQQHDVYSSAVAARVKRVVA